LWLKTLYRKRAVTWPFIFYTIIWTLSKKHS
ncbi:VOC family protein, partial [Enterococcus faecium]